MRSPPTRQERFRRSKLFYTLRAWKQRYRLHLWTQRGGQTPPPVLFKHNLVKQFGELFTIDTFIETGTARGDMLDAQKENFNEICSVELDHDLCDYARDRFSTFQHITIYQGDSAEMLPVILSAVTRPALFWLDAHAMVGGITGALLTPVRQELAAILDHPVRDHVILIDDARLFAGRFDYPDLEEVENKIKCARPEWVFEVKNDVVRAHKDLKGIYRT